jgi:serine protease
MTVRIVTDSTADIPPELVEEMQITVVPLFVIFGEEVFRDGVDLTAEEFFRRLRSSTALPRTSQPPPAAFVQVYEDLANPDGILSTLGDDSAGGSPVMTYNWYQGTSMASPHMAGVVALMKSVYPGLTPTQLDQLISGAMSDPNVTSITNAGKGVWNNYLGYGVIDAEKAVLMAQYLAGGGAPTDPVLGLFPAELNFGFSATSMSTAIINRGVGTISGVTVQDYSAQPFDIWLDHTLNGNTLTFTVTRANLPAEDGYYTADVTVSSTNAGTETAHITVSKGATFGSDAGIVYVLLVGMSDGCTVYQVTTTAASGYAYSFTGIAPCEYLLAAGTDLDEDWYIDNNGELFGLYPTQETYEIVAVGAGDNLTSYNFPLQFQGLPTSSSLSRAKEGAAAMRYRRQPFRLSGQ